MSATRRSGAVGIAWLCTAALVASGAALYGSQPSQPPLPASRASDGSATGHAATTPSERAVRLALETPSSLDATPGARTSADFRTVRSGQSKGEIRKVLGRPTTLETYPIKDQEVWSWEYVEAQEHLAFRVIFSDDDRVIWAGTSPWSAVDMSAQEPATPFDREPDR